MIKYALFIFSIVSFLGGAEAFALTGEFITMYPKFSYEESDNVLLKDIASLPKVLDAVGYKKIPFSYLEDNQITKDEVKEFLQKQGVKKSFQVFGEGTRLVFINSSDREVGLLNKVTHFFIKELSKDYENVEVTLRDNKKRYMMLPERYDDIYFTWQADGVPSFKEKVLINFILNEKIIKKIPVWFDIKIEKEVYLAKKSIDARQRLQKDYFYIKRINIAGLASEPVKIEKCCINSMSDFYIDSNQVLLEAGMSASPAILKNEQIRVDSLVGSARVSVHAYAMSDGAIGEFIPVQSASSGDIFLGKVIGYGQLLVGGDQINVSGIYANNF